MADNDKPNKPYDPFAQIGENEAVDEWDLSSPMTQIYKIGRKANMVTAEARKDQVRLRQARNQLKGLNSIAESTPFASANPDWQRAVEVSQNTIRKMRSRMNIRNEAQRDRVIAETTNAIERHFSMSAVNGQVRDLIGEEDIQNAGLSMATALEPEQIAAKKKNIVGQIRRLESEQTSIAQNKLYDKKLNQSDTAIATMTQKFDDLGNLQRQYASLSAAEKMQSKMGIDPESKQEALIKAYKVAQNVTGTVDREKELKSAGLLDKSLTQLKQQEEQQARALIDAFDKLSRITDQTSDEFHSIKKEAEGTAKELKKTQDAIGTVQQNGGGGNRFGGLLNNLPGILSPIGQGIQQMMISQPFQVKQNQIGFSAAANQLYEQRKSALSGNMTDLSLLSSDTFLKAQEGGDYYKAVSRAVSTVNIATGASTAVLGGIQAANGAKNLAGSVGILGSNETMAGVATAVQGGMGAFTNISDIAQGATAQSINLQAQQLQLAQDRENIHVTGAMRQQFYNYTMGVREASLAGGGSVGNRMIRAYEDPRTLQMLETAGIGHEQFTALSAQAAGEQGSVFSTSGIFAARNLERSGFGSMATNMTRMSRLASAGGNNPEQNLGAVLEAAFSKSLDSSKSLNMMVENTAAMVQQSAGAQFGTFDTTKASAGLIANLVNEEAPNKEMALQRAVTASEQFNQINSGTGRNFADMAGVAAIAMSAGVSDVAAINLKSMDNATAAALKAELQQVNGMKPGTERERAEKELAFKLTGKHGLGAFADTVKGTVNTSGLLEALQSRDKSILRSSEFRTVVDDNIKGYNDLVSGKITSEKQLQAPEYAELYKKLGEASKLKGLTVQEFLSGMQGAGDASGGTSMATSALSGKTSGSKEAMDDLATAKFKDMTKEARLAAAELNGVVNALQAIRKATNELSGKLSDESAGDFRNAAAIAAKDFKNAADTFTIGVKDFGTAVNKLRDVKVPVANNDNKSNKH